MSSSAQLAAGWCDCATEWRLTSLDGLLQQLCPEGRCQHFAELLAPCQELPRLILEMDQDKRVWRQRPLVLVVEWQEAPHQTSPLNPVAGL